MSARHYGRHSHAMFGLGVIERGAQRSASGRGEVEAQPGDVITTNPGEVHDGRPLGGAGRAWRMIYLEPEALAAALDGVGHSRLELTAPVCRDAALGTALRHLLATIERWTVPAAPGPLEVMACDEALAGLVGHLPGRLVAGRALDTVRRAPGLRAVRDRLLDELNAPPSLAVLAAMAGLSRFQLVRQFGIAHGLPPYRWLAMQRLERARRRIAAGGALAQVAAEAGFADQSHMTRAFVGSFGFTPGAWRRATVRPRR